jgi:hypothetical protein
MKPVVWKLLLALFAAAALAVAAIGCNTSSPATNCQPTACPNGATYNYCTRGNACAYQVGSQVFVCSSCDDCGQAATQAAQACANLPVDDGGSSSGGDAGNGQTCAAKTACGSTGLTQQECTTLGPDGQCSSIEYKTSDGKTFACNGCSCMTAEEQLSAYCANPGTGNPVTTCTSAVSCGQELTYQQCTTTNGGVCVSSVYKVSSGQTYPCASCNDCASATDEVESFCSSQGNPTTSCTSSVACGSGGQTYSECTTTSVAGVCQSIMYELSGGGGYTCASCTDCTLAYDDLTSYCDSQNPTTSCSTSSPCGSGGATYDSCTTSIGSTCQSIDYETSTGVVYDCNSCNDCAAAYDDILSYCATLTTTTVCSPACGSAATCCNCSGTPTCYTLVSGETCASFGCTN